MVLKLDWRLVVVVLVFGVGLALAGASVFGSSGGGDTVIQESAVAGESCGGTGVHDADHICPNTGKPEVFSGKEPVLQAKCRGCPSNELNGGKCPGKYV
jgi:hypothetical protein